METIGTMGRKPKTAGIPVNIHSSPALLVCGPGPVPKVKLLVSANGGFSALPMSGGGGKTLTIGKDSYAVLQSLIRRSQLTVKVTGGFLRLNNLFTKATEFRVM